MAALLFQTKETYRIIFKLPDIVLNTFQLFNYDLYVFQIVLNVFHSTLVRRQRRSRTFIVTL